MNNRNNLSAISALLLIAAFALPAGHAVAQDAKSVAGTYTLVSNSQYGDNARGQLILSPDGHYSIILASATLPKIASNSRIKGTAEENKAIVDGSIAHFGKYTVDADDKNITFNVEVSTFPNYDGRTFKRALKVSGDQLTYTNNTPSSGGEPHDVVWKRVK
ncbi:lipocalin-like domain-containing protein [Burkholderia sp. Ac-20353]|uniref:lipocalin-like domain-containing protein n=1 Tax=Burkholderia sp. Ac-20353 TaxID=2703894 RepID=UPI00197B7C96|nr:lipocalin-like domain-containing protein [Burkholderia sp. Ac-20353]